MPLPKLTSSVPGGSHAWAPKDNRTYMSPRHRPTPRTNMRIHSKDSPGSLELLPLDPESSSLFLNKSRFTLLRKKIIAAQWLSVAGQTLAENLTARNPSTREAEPRRVRADRPTSFDKSVSSSFRERYKR